MASVQGVGTTVAVVGLGLMGSALADALIAGGFEVVVWNRTQARAQRFADAGVRVAASVAEAAEACDVMVGCLLDHPTSMALLRVPTVAGTLRGKSLLQLATMTSAQARELGKWAQDEGIACLEGQILCYPDHIRGKRGMIVCAGPRGVWESCRAVLEAMAPSSPHLSETFGAAAMFDKAHFEVLFPAYLGFLHGAAICESAGIPVQDYTRLMIEVCFKRGLAEYIVADIGERAANGRYDDGVKATLDVYSTALPMTVEEGNALGIASDHLLGSCEIFDAACAAGHGDRDLAAVFELFRTKS